MTRKNLEFVLGSFIWAANGCASDELASASEISSSGTTSSTTTPTTTIPTTSETGTTSEPLVMYDPVMCPTVECLEAKDCCLNPDDDNDDCPSLSYPNNWTCFLGSCVNQGCSDSSDCTNIIEGFECLTVDGFARCVVPCTDGANYPNDVQCAEKGMAGTHCIGVSTTANFCLEGPLP